MAKLRITKTTFYG